jgi:hypothetical protein
MALYKYLTKEKDKLVEGEEFVKANELVEEILKEERIKYFHPNRYEIGQYASEHGNASASRKFSPMFDKKISESTVRGLKSVYQKEMKKMKRYPLPLRPTYLFLSLGICKAPSQLHI